MGKIYAYHRFSTDEQDAQSQRNIIAKYAESKGLQIDEIISDEGISGSVSYKKRNLSELLSKTNKRRYYYSVGSFTPYKRWNYRT